MTLLRILAVYSVFIMFYVVSHIFLDKYSDFFTKLATIILYAPVIAVLLWAFIDTFQKK